MRSYVGCLVISVGCGEARGRRGRGRHDAPPLMRDRRTLGRAAAAAALDRMTMRRRGDTPRPVTTAEWHADQHDRLTVARFMRAASTVAERQWWAEQLDRLDPLRLA